MDHNNSELLYADTDSIHSVPKEPSTMDEPCPPGVACTGGALCYYHNFNFLTGDKLTIAKALGPRKGHESYEAYRLYTELDHDRVSTEAEYASLLSLLDFYSNSEDFVALIDLYTRVVFRTNSSIITTWDYPMVDYLIYCPMCKSPNCPSIFDLYALIDILMAERKNMEFNGPYDGSVNWWVNGTMTGLILKESTPCEPGVRSRDSKPDPKCLVGYGIKGAR